MSRQDIRGLLVGLVGAWTGACASGGEHGDGYRCDPQPPSEARQDVPMTVELCSAPAPAAAADAAPSASAPPASTRPLEVATDPAAAAASPDPATCEVDCNRACPGGACERVSPTIVSCVRMFGGHPCGRLVDGAVAGPERASAIATDTERLHTMFELETISAFAFTRLASELELLGAPADLVAQARENAADERRHARLVRERLEARGVSPRDPVVSDGATRTLLAIAEENAVEGCARETIGAAIALAAATRAATAEDRAFYAAIAGDELTHAAWSWALHAWARSRMPGGGAALDARRDAALETFASGIDPTDLPGVSVALAADLRALARAVTTVVRLER